MLVLTRRALLVLFVRPIVRLIIGLDARGRNFLPKDGPAIVAANHNSHVDTILLMCLFPSAVLRKVRPVAAADHFLRAPFISWFARRIIGIVPVNRTGFVREDVLAGCKEALGRGEILLIFPEGTRGAAEEMGRFKTGIARLAEEFPEAPITPVYLQGAGRVLPRGAFIPVPFTCSAIVGEPFRWGGNRQDFMQALRSAIEALSADAPPLRWL